MQKGMRRKDEKERKEERNEQASILYMRVPAQQREIKHRGVTKTAEALLLQCNSKNEDVLSTDIIIINEILV
jgi:hypothetical protein